MAFAPTYKEPQFINPPGASRRSRSSLDEGYLRTSSNTAGIPTIESQLAAALKFASNAFGRRPFAERNLCLPG